MVDLAAVARRLAAVTAVTIGLALGAAWAPAAWGASSSSFFSAAGLGTMPVARYGPAAASLPNGDVLIAGGDNTGGIQSSAELFNPITETFSAVSGAMTTARWVEAAATLPNGDVLIAGGESGGGKLKSAELFNPVSDTFSVVSLGSMTTVRNGAVAVSLPNGDVLIAEAATTAGRLTARNCSIRPTKRSPRSRAR